MTYAFVLDASACSGCKACQVACKDRNQLPLGVLWRRVYEVSGGAWQQEGAAWTSTLFAYNLSLSCNHCVHPKCAGVCPVDAYSVRPDGIVILDSSKCIGCGYCAWACPYGAPQYDGTAGRMTKCDFCYGNLDLGLPPACVSACPLRVLDYAQVSDGQTLAADHVALWETPPAAHPYPMPDNSHTQPHLAIKPHAGMKSMEEKVTANFEEVYLQGASERGEAPLVGFTLLVQMAVGGFWAMLWLFHDVRLQFLPALLIGLCLGAGLMSSFAHLGARRNAWRVLNHLRKSWLSREILFTILFGAGWLATLTGIIFHADISILSWLTALIGLGLVHCMSQVYHLRSVPAWNSWRTDIRFFISAALLGILGMVPLLTWIHIPPLQRAGTGLLVIALLITQAVIAGSQSLSIGRRRFQFGFMLAGMIGCAIVFFVPGWFGLYSTLVILLIILTEQGVGRWFFYQARTG
jgi:anaerobic dimethyl sulfoxide reductase subunit B (iron-sulfur subunit)